MKNWRTFLGGIIGSLGAYMQSLADPIPHLIGQILVPLGTFLIGMTAADAAHVETVSK